VAAPERTASQGFQEAHAYVGRRVHELAIGVAGLPRIQKEIAPGVCKEISRSVAQQIKRFAQRPAPGLAPSSAGVHGAAAVSAPAAHTVRAALDRDLQ